jgi:mannosyl-3-phosphoglycerate phosphatase
MSNLIVFTDLDGSLLDGTTYSYKAAIPALTALREQGIPLVLASSKTRAEMEPIRERLDLHNPFIVENGGAVFVPHGFFEFPLERMRTRPPYQVMELGLPYHMLREVLKRHCKGLATCR